MHTKAFEIKKYASSNVLRAKAYKNIRDVFYLVAVPAPNSPPHLTSVKPWTSTGVGVSQHSFSQLNPVSMSAKERGCTM